MRSYGRTFEFFRLDGLLLFCIIMGLRSASSAIISDVRISYNVTVCLASNVLDKQSIVLLVV